jgi:hypothetical protein
VLLVAVARRQRQKKNFIFAEQLVNMAGRIIWRQWKEAWT